MAKKFTFRLQKVLEYRKLEKDERKKVLLEKNLRLSQVEGKQEQIVQELARGVTASGAENTPGALELFGMYHSRLREELHAVEEELVMAQLEQERALEHYQEAARAEEALLRLREKKETIHREDVLREEAAFLDELGTQKGNTQYGADDGEEEKETHS
ncbi:hypothetical protein MRY87_00990 [bacterium]|nr:hypothetical protein [bacterium]